MALSLKVKSLIFASSLCILMLAAQEAVQAEPVVSSYYGGELAGSPTASGEPFEPQGLTAAHPSLPLGTMLTVSYNGRSVNVRVNDRGPFVAGRGLDLSLGAAQTLGLTGPGSGVVDIKPAGAPEAKESPVAESEAAEPAKPAPAIPSVSSAPSAEVKETKEPTRFLSEDALIPPGERIADYMSEGLSPQPPGVDDYRATNALDPPATRSPEIRREEPTQTLHLRPIALGRRKGVPGEAAL